MTKLKVMYILDEFPQISETYIRSEIEALSRECEIRVISLREADTPYISTVPYQLLQDPVIIREVIDEFDPHVLHGHWLQQTRILAYFAGYFGDDRTAHSAIPFTVRAHSFDTLDPDGKYIRAAARMLNSELCLGVLSFPFTRPLLEQGGVRSEKIFDCYPVVNYRRFYDTSPNGDAVMNVGACLPKKRMEDFLELAKLLPDREFNLYAMGYDSQEFHRLNAAMGHPVNLVPPVEPEEMLAEYKKHKWLVYTASREMNTVGWALSVAEAQAAGLGVCLPNIRPDLRDYLGGAGFLYDSVSEAADIISKPYPEEMRQLGFEQARKSDIFEHKSILLNLWQKAAGQNLDSQPLADRRSSEVPAWGDGDSVPEQFYNLQRAAHELMEATASGATVIVADDPNQWSALPFVSGRLLLPFLESEGQFNGPPVDDANAIEELERLRQAGVGYMVFGAHAFWWFDYYKEFDKYLRSKYRCVLENKRLAVFKLRA
jgi:hypothetical protein